MRKFLPLFIVGFIALFILAVVGVGLYMVGYGLNGIVDWSGFDKTPPPTSHEGVPQPFGQQRAGDNGTLMQARQDFKTLPMRSTYRPSLDPPERVPGASLIEYASGNLNLVAYLSKERKSATKRPAVVWAHGGFGGIGKESWENAKPFHDAGFVLMVPSFRGENQNLGRFEMFYGEVDDLLAAVEHLAKNPSVDPERIYVVGHSSGGTLTLLAATTGTTKVRAFFSIAGMPDTEDFLRATRGLGYQEASPPFEPFRTNEGVLRSASPFVTAIRQPTFYFGAPTDERYLYQAQLMQRVALNAGIPFKTLLCKGRDHFNIITPVVELIAAKIAADVNPNLKMDISAADFHAFLNK